MGVTLGGLAAAFAGVALEFWAVLLQDEPTAHDAGAVGEGVWWGSDVGWAAFVLGVFALLAGGPTVAVALRRSLAPRWLLVFVALLGLGVMAAVVFRGAVLPVAALAFAPFAAGWLALARLLRRGPLG